MALQPRVLIWALMFQLPPVEVLHKIIILQGQAWLRSPRLLTCVAIIKLIIHRAEAISRYITKRTWSISSIQIQKLSMKKVRQNNHPLLIFRAEMLMEEELLLTGHHPFRAMEIQITIGQPINQASGQAWIHNYSLFLNIINLWQNNPLDQLPLIQVHQRITKIQIVRVDSSHEIPANLVMAVDNNTIITNNKHQFLTL